RAVVTPSGRPHALRVGAEGIDVGLVDRAPPVHLAAELARAETHELAEAIDRGAVLPAALIRDPQRIGEMMERDERRQPMTRQRGEDLMIVHDLAAIDAPLLGLEAAPLERQAVRVVPIAGGQREVFVEALVMPASGSAHVAVRDLAGQLLESPP